MKNLFKEAHRMTREMMKKYNDIDYSAQFTLCLEYLRKEGKNMIKAELKGTEKQIKWAEDIRSELIEKINAAKENEKMIEAMEAETCNVMTVEQLFDRLEKRINEVEEAEFFIDHRKATLEKYVELLNVIELVTENEENVLTTEETNRDLAVITIIDSNTVKIEKDEKEEEKEIDKKDAYKIGIELLKEGYKVTCNKRSVREHIKALYSIK